MIFGIFDDIRNKTYTYFFRFDKQTYLVKIWLPYYFIFIFLFKEIFMKVLRNITHSFSIEFFNFLM